ncbi:MAG: MBL fold metallo-hydrolase [Armatimonadota bacterium]|nr:MBL fold metallo-hydrolase [Armatimonadota bacterium]
MTGSLHVVEANGSRIFLDCGLFQGRRADAFEWNQRFPVPPADVDAVVLSHAHLDHCGNLPTLVAQGFRGPIFCTPATRDLAGLVLRDAVKVQRQDIDIVNRIRRRQGLPRVRPLYRGPEAEHAIRLMRTVRYGEAFQAGRVRATFYDAGHILGSAMVLVEAGGRRLGFTGDLGRQGTEIIRDPQVLPAVDLLITESTYGSRDHDTHAEAIANLASIVTRTTARGGRVLIPAFAIGRTQEIVHALMGELEGQRIPDGPVFVDSPMAVDATAIFRRHPECFDDETRARLRRRDPFGFKNLRYVRALEDSKALVARDDPCVVIATSGMAEGGRILLHLQRFIGDPRATLLFVGYQAEHTLGRRILDGAEEVRIFGETHKVGLQVERADAFSAHADRRELLAWALSVPKIGRAFCVHGDLAPAQALAGALSAHGIPASVPMVGQTETV